jgi:hypothetical protein
MNLYHPYPIFSPKDFLLVKKFLIRIFSLPYHITYSQDPNFLNVLYRRLGRLVSNLSRRYVVLHLPKVRRKLHWALFFTFARASFTWWKRVLLEPKGYLQKMVKKQGIVLLLAAFKGHFALGRPQPAPQAPPPAAGGCSPLELVIGMFRIFSATKFSIDSIRNSPRHNRATGAILWYHCRRSPFRSCSETHSWCYWVQSRLPCVFRPHQPRSWKR